MKKCRTCGKMNAGKCMFDSPITSSCGTEIKVAMYCPDCYDSYWAVYTMDRMEDRQ